MSAGEKSASTPLLIYERGRETVTILSEREKGRKSVGGRGQNSFGTEPIFKFLSRQRSQPCKHLPHAEKQQRVLD